METTQSISEASWAARVMSDVRMCKQTVELHKSAVPLCCFGKIDFRDERETVFKYESLGLKQSLF